MQRGKNDERTCDALTATQRELISNPPSQCLGRDTTNGNDKIKLSENFVELQSKCSHRLCSAAGASPSRKTQPKIASRFVVQKRIAGIVIALCLTTATNSVSFAQEAAKPVTATEPASGLAFREGGRRILIGKEGGIFFVAAQQVVRNEVGLDNANSIKVHSLIEQYCHELDTMRGRGGPLDSQEMQNLRDLTPEEREKRLFERVKTIEATVGKASSTLASMGIYVFNTKFLLNRLEEDAQDTGSAHDFGKNIIPRMVEHDRTFAFPFNGYWVDVGTIFAYWETNLALLDDSPALNLYDPNWVIHTRSKERPPAKLGSEGSAHTSLVSNGCVIEGTVIHSVLSPGVRVESGAVVRDSVVMTDTIIRTGAVVDRCVLDKEIEIGAGAQVGAGDMMTPNLLEPANLNTGITIAGKQAHIPAGAIIGRNCRIDAATTPADYDQLQVPSGATISKRRSVVNRIK